MTKSGLYASFCTYFIGGLMLIASQQLTPEDDQVFLETIQAEINLEVSQAQKELVKSARGVGTVAEQYAKSKLTQNIFRALRVLAEKELEQIPHDIRLRQPRQEDDEDSASSGSSNSGGNEEDAGDSGTASTTKRTVPLIPVLAGILKSVFGGGENATQAPLNVTHTLQHASKLFFSPITNFQSLLTSGRRQQQPTPKPVTVIKYVPVYQPEPSTEKILKIPITTPPPLRLVGREDLRRQPRSANGGTYAQTNNSNWNLQSSVYAPAYAPTIPLIPNQNSATTEYPPKTPPPTLIYAPAHPAHKLISVTTVVPPPVNIPEATTVKVISSSPAPKPKPQAVFIPAFAEVVAEKPAKVQVKPENSPQPPSDGVVLVATERSPAASSSASPTSTTTTEAPKPGVIYVDSLARDVQTGFDGLIKNLPDLLKGAKEAIGLLANLREIFGEEEDG